VKAVVEEHRIVGRMVSASLVAMQNTVALNAELGKIDERLQIEEYKNNSFQIRCLFCCSGFKFGYLLILNKYIQIRKTNDIGHYSW
jgi:hypothetical protein